MRKSSAEIIELGWEHNALDQLDLLISEARDKLEHSPVSIAPAGNVNAVRIQTFDNLASELDLYFEGGTVFSVQSQGICAQRPSS